ncbi:MAG: aminoacyl-tRNA hydrolase [bacterium]|nr:MAG: aminoacyl-tRNA hydrolase [bacterium]
MWLIAGLGNPSPEYEKTRHNLGFKVLDLIAQRWGINIVTRRGVMAKGRGRYRNEQVLLVKPLTFMNRSGAVLAPVVEAENLSGQRILVLVDDMDLPLGTVRYRRKGGSAGHRGMDSIISSLGFDDFHRIRIGIGRPEHQDDNVSYVLSGFSDKELPVVNRMVNAAADLAGRIISEGEMEPVTIKTEDIEEEL